VIVEIGNLFEITIKLAFSCALWHWRCDTTALCYSFSLLVPALKSSYRNSATSIYQAKLFGYTISSTLNYAAGALESQTSCKITTLTTEISSQTWLHQFDMLFCSDWLHSFSWFVIMLA